VAIAVTSEVPAAALPPLRTFARRPGRRAKRALSPRPPGASRLRGRRWIPRRSSTTGAAARNCWCSTAGPVRRYDLRHAPATRVFAVLVPCFVSLPANAAAYDVIVYGGTSAGVIAAVQAKRLGKSVVIVCPDDISAVCRAGDLVSRTRETKP